MELDRYLYRKLKEKKRPEKRLSMRSTILTGGRYFLLVNFGFYHLVSITFKCSVHSRQV